MPPPASTPTPAVAFPDERSRPTDEVLEQMLGRSFTSLARVRAALFKSYPDARSEWKFARRSGWYMFLVRGERRLLYVVPLPGAFRLSLIIGPKAVAALERGPHRIAIKALLPAAKTYPEGIAFTFEPSSCDPALIQAMIAAKLDK